MFSLCAADKISVRREVGLATRELAPVNREVESVCFDVDHTQPQIECETPADLAALATQLVQDLRSVRDRIPQLTLRTGRCRACACTSPRWIARAQPAPPQRQ